MRHDHGNVFRGWDGADGLTFNKGSAATATAEILMPARDVTLTATYETGYTLSVRNGSGSGLYAAGASVTAKANAAPSGQQFKEWIGISDSWIISGSKSTPTVTFRMPSYNQTVFASYGNSRSLTVENGTGGGSCAEGARVTVTADPAPEHKRFREWTIPEGVQIASGSRYTQTVTIIIPAQDVSMTANYEDDIYSVTVENGTGGGNYFNGAAVTVTADPPAEGMQFKEWTGTDGLTFTEGGASDPMAVFTMPGRQVSLTATYDELILHTVTVISDGNGAARASLSSAARRTEVVLTAEPDYGYGFKEWQVLSGGVTVNKGRFTMGDEDVVIRAVFAEESDYRLELPELVTVTPDQIYTPVQVNVTDLSMIAGINGKTPVKLRIQFFTGALTDQDGGGKTIATTIAFSTEPQNGYPDNVTISFPSAQSKNVYLRISSDSWNAASPGTYTGRLNYRVFWVYEEDNSVSKVIRQGAIPVTLTIHDPADVEAAAAVDNLIDAIGEVSLDSGDAIEEARAAYDALTDTQKALVANYATLTAVEEAYAALAPKELTINAQPADCAVAYREMATATFSVSGDGLTYQWYGRNPGQTEFWESSLTGDTYSVAMVPNKSGRQVYCVATDAYGNSATSNIVTLTMQPSEEYALTVIAQPVNCTVNSGEGASTTFAVSGDGLTYQWYGRDEGQTKFWKSGLKGDTYGLKMMVREKVGRQVYCVVTDVYGNTVTSDTVTLAVNVPEGYALTVGSQPVDCEAGNGKIVSTTFVVAGEDLTYQWYGRDVGQTKFWKSRLKGDTYALQMVPKKSGRQVYCVVTDAYGNTVTSDIVTLTLK